ncbi:4Fe-4S binding protein [Solitalea lacus]|uniref:4Fe-4S binding protein n=1 Tax=Solitalea lacus TaxID=2911172 RepID=UPI001EDAA19C|nr:4Fe-4S binding protein [Solitalea lacus]UKJ08890.1 4Fe-4S binding protein [Solitalea lacus]
MKKNSSNIISGIRSVLKGMSLTIQHIWAARNGRKHGGIANDKYFEQQEGVVTIQYPHQQIPVPEVGRYQLHVEIDDCVVCDLCAKICPVDCITIESIKAVEDIGKTSDGTTKRLHASKFFIDHAKCMYCGLCTTVCPTECITMTSEYDVSVFDIKEMDRKFSVMTETEADEKKMMLDKYNTERAAAKAAALKKG